MKSLFIITLVWVNSFCFGMNQYQISVDYGYAQQDADAIHRGIGQYNTPYFGNQKTIHCLICLKDEQKKVVGGIIAWMRPGIGLLFIDTLWVSEELRGQGYGKKLVLAAEAEGLKQNCTHSQLETLAFQAKEFYAKLGYVQVGFVEKLYGEHDAYYMRKSLIPAGK